MKDLYRQLLRQRGALQNYLRGLAPSIESIRKGLFLSERERDPKRPDHYLRQAGRMRIDGHDSLNALLLGTLDAMSEHYLVRAGYQHVCVRSDRFEQWQDLITDFPALLVVAYRLHDAMPIIDAIEEKGPFSHEDVLNYADKVYRPQLRYSSLPTVHDPRLNYLIKTHGLDEMHMHLNGSTEVEMVWLDALRKPDLFWQNFQKGRSNREVEELLSQEDPGLDHHGLMRRLHAARAIREWIGHEVLLLLADPERAQERKRHTACILEIVTAAANGSESPVGSAGLHWCSTDLTKHEIERMWPRIAGVGEGALEPLTLEAVFMAAVFHALKVDRSDALAHAVYFYLLCMAQFARLLVQQREQWGFDQFQKITLNEMREMTETSYENRFHQLNYTREGDLDTLEGRFAPKPTRESNELLLTQILSGYLRFLSPRERAPRDLEDVLDELDSVNNGPDFEKVGRSRKPSLILVAHFIKAEDKDNRLGRWPCRHFDLRNNLEGREKTLAETFHKFPRLRRYITGFDGAANELHAPPEVFAPVFRRLRRRGFPHFTFHAGEDFIHLLSGIRAVYEAICHLGLGAGNRIGHATAVGLEPALWRERMGNQIVINRGQRLDDLVLARHLLLRHPDPDLRCLPRLDLEISRLCQEIYGADYSPTVLFEAWQMRTLDPTHAFNLRGESTLGAEKHDREERKLVEDAKHRKGAFHLFERYHGRGDGGAAATRYNEPIEVLLDDEPLDAQTTRQVQEAVLQEIRTRQICIEALPTSNLRISVYERYREHHIFRWLGIHGDKPVRVCIGSDDPGIFATNLRNEYAHVLRELDDLAPSRTEELLELLIRTAKTWRFSAASNLDDRTLRVTSASSVSATP